MTPPVLPWREVTPFEPVNGGIKSLLDTVDSLRSVWQLFVESASAAEFAEARKRSLRRHAVETGIIERLYDVDWGVTEALVAEGITLEAAEREGGSISPETLDMIRSQHDALEYLVQVARGHRPLTAQLVRELHQLITRHQPTYAATDALGNPVLAQLHHGEWKRLPNHVRRQDGTILEYAPPEQVEHQVQLLVELHRQMGEVHPVARAAWLHHRFICIHPFEDGNGRVARALVLLDLLKDTYAPLVVDRTRRDEYLGALDAANEGDLSRLIRLFAELEMIALRFELHEPVATTPGASAVAVARAYSERIQRARQLPDEERRKQADELASGVYGWLRRRLEGAAAELEGAFQDVDPRIRRWIDSAAPPGERSLWWRHQLVRAAKQANFWANRTNGAWWVRLEIEVLGRVLRYVVAIQAVGDRDVGVRAVTVFAEMPQPKTEEERFVPPVELIRLSSADSVTLVGGQRMEDVEPDVDALVERTLAAAVDQFGRQLT